MVQSATPLIGPTREHPGEEKEASRAPDPLLARNLEDQCLADRVERALCATGYGAMRTVRIAVNAQVVVLEGRVSSYYLKQVAQSAALAVPGVHQIRNGLEIIQPTGNHQQVCAMRQPQSKLGDPLDETTQTTAPEPTVRQPCAMPGVLVVDDDHLVRIMVQLGLERNGFDVWLARDGREAIDFYRRHTEKIAVVLLDVRMPGMDGPQTLDVLRKLNPAVQACFMSGETGPYKPEELLHSVAAHVIAKPFHLDALANILRLMAHGASADLLPSGAERQG